MSKQMVCAFVVVCFVLVTSVHCAPNADDVNDLPIRVRRSPQIPGLPQVPSGIPGTDQIPGVGMFKSAGGLAKNVPGADSVPIPRPSRSVTEPTTDDMETMAIRMKREARGTGNLPTKTG